MRDIKKFLCGTKMAQAKELKPKKIVAGEISNAKILKNMGYTIGRKIGEGTYSRVCVAVRNWQNTRAKFACKIINKRFAGVEFIKRFLPRELKIITMVDHPNIVTVSNIIEINEIIYMFMDYCRNGDLLEYIRANGALEENKAKHCFRQLAEAVEYLHNRNLAHRDLKCENVLLTVNNSVKLGDFGFSRSCINEQSGGKILSNTFCGSAAYAAPEILQGIPYDPKMYDIWALGCILYIMLSASMPFDDTNIKKMLKSQMSKSVCFQKYSPWYMHSLALSCLMGQLLEPHANKRATIKDVVSCQWLHKSSLKNCKHFETADSKTATYS